MSVVIFLFIFVFSFISWYFYANPKFDPSKCGKRLVGYYRGWGDKEVPGKSLKMLTHVIFLSAVMEKSGNVKFQNEIRERSFLELLEKSRRENPRMKVMVAIGSGPLPSLDFLVEEENQNGTFTTSILNFIEKFQVDGIELQWKSWPKEETLHKIQVIRNLRESLNQLSKTKNRQYLLSFSLPSSEWNNSEYCTLDDLLNLVDFANVASFDYSSSSPGPFSPLYHSNKSVDQTMKNYACQTEKWTKINMGVGFYGRVWKNITNPWNDLNQTLISGNLNVQTDTIKFRNLSKTFGDLEKSSWDEETKSSHIFDSQKLEYISFESEKSVLEKMKYVVEKDLGGVAISILNFDDDENSLLNAMTSVDLCSRDSKKFKYPCDELFVNI